MINNSVGPMKFGSNNNIDRTLNIFVVGATVTNLFLLEVAVVVFVVNKIFQSNVSILLVVLD